MTNYEYIKNIAEHKDIADLLLSDAENPCSFCVDSYSYNIACVRRALKNPGICVEGVILYISYKSDEDPIDLFTKIKSMDISELAEWLYINDINVVNPSLVNNVKGKTIRDIYIDANIKWLQTMR